MKEEYDKLVVHAQAMSDLKDGWQRRALEAEADAKDWRQYGHDCNVKWADTEDELEAAKKEIDKLKKFLEISNNAKQYVIGLAATNGAKIVELKAEVARQREIIGWAPDTEEFTEALRERNGYKDERDAANAKLLKIRFECETFYSSISESHDATALADAIIQHIDSDK